MTDRFVLARSDTREAPLIVSGDYQIVQPKEVLEFYRDLVANVGYSLETAGALAGGRKVWALARTGLMRSVDPQGEDRVNAYVLLATSCDKTLATTAAFTSVRVVCQNTLAFAMEDIRDAGRKQAKVPHTRRFDTDAVIKRLGVVSSAWETFMRRARDSWAEPDAAVAETTIEAREGLSGDSGKGSV